ncbi:hypothetical protein ARMSODRAFT_1017292 [Armillaria solidipes]|uniref:Uncharacterized protein n=1 Tax=Armillaria solidipes TaxID=1076256 RepID=A0A2H3BKG8_9AGAR|nr:hypothetical protein ARMSODRAFT_1017292 [Armillaria solidipes]
MSNSIKYPQSATPEPYKSTLTPEGLTSEQYKVFTEERATAEEKYEEAVGAHDEWKAAKTKEAWLEKLKMDKEAQAEKLKNLQKLEEEQKAAEKKEQEKQEAEDKQKKLDELKKAKEAMDVMVEKKKKKDDLKKKEKKLCKEKKKKEKVAAAAESGKGDANAAEVVLVDERETNGDTEGEKSEASKKKAFQRLKEKCDGKCKALEPAGIVVESKEEDILGPSKKTKVESMGPTENEEELKGNRWSEMLCSSWTKKAACSFNKGNSASITISSEEVSEAIQKLMSTVDALINKVDQLTGEVTFLWSCVRDFIDNFDTEDIQSPEDILSVSNVDEWNMSQLELEDLKGVNSEALWRVMQWRLDKDMVQLRAQGLAEPEKMNADNTYKISNCEFWYGLGGEGKLGQMKLVQDYFQATRNEFYKLGGCQSEWQVWKVYLLKHYCEEFFVEDSDPEEKVLDGKVQKAQKPYGPDLGIAALDGLFILDDDLAVATTSGEGESDEESENELESVKGDSSVPAGGKDNVEMEEVVNVVGAGNA